jgi:hypothetical protein
MSANIDMDAVYWILVRIAETQDTMTYDDLSIAYKVRTGTNVSRRSWGQVLGELSARCTNAGLPSLSTLVVTTDGLPGDGYWGIPGSPPRKDYVAWTKVRDTVWAAKWPKVLPP